MNRTLSTFCVFIMAIILGSVLFVTSQKVQHAEKELQTLQKKTAIEEDSLRVLKAEWTYLNRPERLEVLSAQYLTSDEKVKENNRKKETYLPVAALGDIPFAPVKNQIIMASYTAPAKNTQKTADLEKAKEIKIDTAEKNVSAQPPSDNAPRFKTLLARLTDEQGTAP